MISYLSFLLIAALLSHAYQRFAQKYHWYSIKGLADFFAYCAPIAVIIIFTKAIFIDRLTIPSQSMLPNFLVGQSILIDPAEFHFVNPYTNNVISERDVHADVGDVVVSLFPLSQDIHYIKRVIAVAGDTISITRQYIELNGERYEFVFSGEQEMFDGTQMQQYDRYIVNVKDRVWNVVMRSELPFLEAHNVTVPNNAVFLIGDNLTMSTDSRKMGVVDVRFLRSKVT